MKNLFSVAGKTAVVTGGSTGIGAMIARGFVENGVKTYITARKADALEATAAELSNLGECIAIQSDLSTLAGVNGFADAVMAQEDQIDILVNNAGAAWGAPVDNFPEGGWDKIMDLNVKAMFFMTQRFLPHLRKAGSAEDPSRVINIASINGITHPTMPTYSYGASKAAVIQLTRHMAADLASDNININGIAPGFFPSKMTAGWSKDETMMKHVLAKIPTHRLGTPEDMAGTALYLCSRASTYVCGHTLVLDGGMVAGAG